MRTFIPVLILAAVVQTASAQAGDNDPHAIAKVGFDEVSANLMKSAEMVPADKYGYKPTATVRTFGQMVAHVVDGHNYYCARAAGRGVQWSDAVEKGPTDKATLVAKLKASIGMCNAAYAAAGNLGPKLANYGHDSLHYGNLITYLRMMGMVPPSS
jgi:uncharacterized damage-inducible protein DinB